MRLASIAVWAGLAPAAMAVTYKLNSVQLLLPYTAPESHRCSYLLQAEGGCFEWYGSQMGG